MGKVKNVFISHYKKDEEHIGKLKELVSNKKEYKLRNSSVDSTKYNNAKSETYIEGMLRDRIKWADVFICLIGGETHKRDWVNKEIQMAKNKEKRIIGVYINGESNSTLPENLEKYADSVVGWDSNKIIDAINGRSNNWENPDGTERAPKNIPREVC